MSSISYKLTFKKFFVVAGIPGFVLMGRQIVMSLISRQRSFGEVTDIDTSATIQIAMAIIAFVVGLRAFKKHAVTRNLVFRSPLVWFLAYSIWGALTSIWSVDGMLSSYRSFECIAWFILICSVLSHLHQRLDTMDLVRWILYFALFTIFFNLMNRARQFGLSVFSIETLFREQMGSTPYFFLALLLPVGWVVKLIILPISIFSLSNTAYAGMAGGFISLYTGKGTMRKLILIATVALFLTISFVGVETLLKHTIFYGKEGVGMEYTTGRDKIFTKAIQEAKARPLTGFGFVSGDVFIITKAHQGAIGAHNGILSALLGTGVIGMCLFVMFLVKIFLASGSKHLPDRFRVPFLASAILISIHTLGNPGLGSRVYGTWIPAMLVFSLICIIQQHYKYQALYENHMGDT